MSEITIVSTVGSICTDPEYGTVICDLVCEQLAQGEEVTLNFDGVTLVASAFLNTAVGCIFGSLSPEHVSSRLKFSGLDEIDHSLVLLVIEKAIRFYSTDSTGQERLAATAPIWLPVDHTHHAFHGPS
jgi:hypothetical protein